MKKRILSMAMAFVLCLALLPNVALAAEKPSTWAETDVNKAIAAKLVPETLQAQYTQTITRAEFTALVVALYESVKGNEITERTKFNDTTDINVEKAAAIGVVSGTGNNDFSPNQGLTREQAATMLARLAESAGKPLTKQAASFADNSSISSWALDAVGQMQASGIMGGTGNNAFDSQGAYTREQSIVTILRLYDFVSGTVKTPVNDTAYKMFEGITYAIPDFTDVTGIPVKDYSSSTRTYYYGENTVTISDVQKYVDVLKEMGFTPYSSSDSFTWDESSIPAARGMSFVPPNVDRSQYERQSTIPTIKISRVSGPSFSITFSHLGEADGDTKTEPTTDYPMYEKYPSIPDFGAVFGVSPLKAEPGLMRNMFSYQYDMGEIDKAARSITGSSYESGLITTDYYENILEECGFSKEWRKSNGGDMLIYWERSGYSVRISVDGDADLYNNRVIVPFTYSIIIQKLY